MIERDGLMLVYGQRLRRPFGSLTGRRRRVSDGGDGGEDDVGGIPDEKSPQTPERKLSDVQISKCRMIRSDLRKRWIWSGQ